MATTTTFYTKRDIATKLAMSDSHFRYYLLNHIPGLKPTRVGKRQMVYSAEDVKLIAGWCINHFGADSIHRQHALRLLAEVQ